MTLCQMNFIIASLRYLEVGGSSPPLGMQGIVMDWIVAIVLGVLQGIA